jgi:beta-lactamase class A
MEAILNQLAALLSSCDAMTAMLEKQQCTNRIPHYLPPDARRGSKTWQIAGVTNDVGFVMTERGILVISAFCEELPNEHVGERSIGDITRAGLEITGGRW